MVQENEGKIDLSGVNKEKRSFKLPKISKLFKKSSAGPGRDDEGKFTSGGGGLLSTKKLNLRRTLPVVVVVALVGGFFVFRSFASVTKPSAYQYSITTCTDINSKQKNANTTCQDKSAEALVYRMQQATLGYQSDWGYKTWTQKLAGDRSTSQRIAEEAEALPEVRWGNISNKDFVEKVATYSSAQQRAGWTRELDQKKLSRTQFVDNLASFFKTSVNKVLTPSYKLNNQQFVGAIYTKLLKRTIPVVNTKGAVPQVPANDYWVQQLSSEKMTRAQVIVSIAKSSEAINSSRADMVKYVTSKPKVKITQTAKAKQDIRNRQLAVIVTSAKTHYEKGALYHQVEASKLPVQASNKASSRAPSRADLNAIGDIQKQAERSRGFARQSASAAQKDYERAEKMYKEAKAVSTHSPDIPSSTAESSRNQVTMYAAMAKNKVNDIQGYINQIADSYKVAETKYQAEQQRLAEEAARRAQEEAARQQQGGGSGGTGAGENGGEEAVVVPPAAGATEAQKKAWCEARPTTVNYVTIPGGRQKITRNPYWNTRQKTCVSTQFFTPTCNTGYRPSGRGCVRSTTDGGSGSNGGAVAECQRRGGSYKNGRCSLPALTRGICKLSSGKYVKSYSTTFGVTSSTFKKSEAKTNVTAEFCNSRGSLVR